MTLGSAWKKESQAGKKYLSCVIQSPFIPGGELRFAIFAVDEKKSENSPDYNIVWNMAKKKAEATSDGVPPPNDGDIPF